MEHFTLYNGIALPSSAFGVFRIPEGEATVQAVLSAIEAGYRHIDTAQGYWNEADVGEAVRRSPVPRQNIFITTKLWMHYYSEQAAYEAVLASAERLGVSYIDLVLLHQAVGDYYGAWRALETLYQEGVIRTIGVSNFTAERLADLCTYSRIRPAVNQTEISPLRQRRDLEAVHAKYGVRMEAWSPLGAGRDKVLKNPVLSSIGAAHDKSAAQVVLRWLYQRGIVGVAKTINPQHMRENLDIYDFALTEEEMALIASLDEFGEDTRDLERADNVPRLRGVVEKYSDRY